MKLANVDGRAVLITDDTTGVDVAEASDGRFGPELPGIYEQWSDFADWADGADLENASTVTFTRSQLDNPSPEPKQVLAIGLNYSEHARESNFEAPTGMPPTFTKFRSALAGPDVTVNMPSKTVDWETELVVIIGKLAENVSEDDAWNYVAGLSIGQDISERTTQLAGPAPQFSLGKSFPKFAPIGPWLVTTDEVENRDDLALGCDVNGEVMQDGRTADLIYSVPRLIAQLSSNVTLYPGDVIFTGTPSGIGAARDPKVFLKDGDRLHSWIEGIGEMTQTFVDATDN